MNSKQFETAKMCLKVVTPINISDGIVLGAKDYLYDSRRQKVFFLNLHQWHMFIYKHMLLENMKAILQTSGINRACWNGFRCRDMI